MQLVMPRIFIRSTELTNTPSLTTTVARYARECYQSEVIDTLEQQRNFLRRVIQRGHESVLEHEKITMHWTCDRGVSHELVRARIASYSQESQRYVDYGKGSAGISFVVPPGFDTWNSSQRDAWRDAMIHSEADYIYLRSLGLTPEFARDALNNAARTRVIVSMNIRELRHTLQLRADKAAHPKFQALAIPLLRFLQGREWTSVLFEDIPYNKDFPEDDYAQVEIDDPLFSRAREAVPYVY